MGQVRKRLYPFEHLVLARPSEINSEFVKVIGERHINWDSSHMLTFWSITRHLGHSHNNKQPEGTLFWDFGIKRVSDQKVRRENRSLFTLRRLVR